MAFDGPALTLSDIFHALSPSPVISQPMEEDFDPSLRSLSPPPEPLDSAQLESIRNRVRELAPTGIYKATVPSREKELLDMLIRVTSSTFPDLMQLHAQAETIAELSQQRDLLIKETEEERARWEAERLGFDRIAEALIARRSRGGDSTYREEELERQVSTLDADNKALRQKLADYHLRVQSVEGELAQLRPVLLMQPYALTHTIHHSHVARGDLSRHSKRRRHIVPLGGHGQEASDDDAEDPAGSAAQPTTVQSAAQIPKARPPRGDYYRRRDSDLYIEPAKYRKRALRRGTATLADARAEHVLLAARKVGRERAALLAGIVSSADRERDKERKKEGDAVAVVPKTPKRIPVGGASGSSTGVIYLNSPVSASRATGTVSASSSFTAVQTPKNASSSTASQQTQSHERSTRNNPRTPLDSLLTAARSISMIEEEEEEEEEDDEDEDEDVAESVPGPSSKPLSRARASDVLDSPLPAKRRRVAAVPSASTPRLVAIRPQGATSARAAEGTSRMRSALDVLADQAAVFRSKDKDTSRGKGKGKGKAKARDVGPPLAPSPSPASSVFRARSPPPTPSWLRKERGDPEEILPPTARRPNPYMRTQGTPGLADDAHSHSHPKPHSESHPPSRTASTAPRASHSRSRSPPPNDRIRIDEPEPLSPASTLPPALARTAVNHVFVTRDVGRAPSPHLPALGDDSRTDS